ncbi:Aste57867_8445 [Aphanomyces stellatus]|uniref:Aste57867_8445 protein n=1 Tax=Aphanomyces stellatus TaxID=120398 RepID=A0A485KKC6_9STRA|nr:hypothetical protein As57867_008413 [Aphanomyces stellatus]VFT85331.1 Aste57867_8445 [Aphanomyces stellatus]
MPETVDVVVEDRKPETLQDEHAIDPDSAFRKATRFHCSVMLAIFCLGLVVLAVLYLTSSASSDLRQYILIYVGAGSMVVFCLSSLWSCVWCCNIRALEKRLRQPALVHEPQEVSDRDAAFRKTNRFHGVVYVAIYVLGFGSIALWYLTPPSSGHGTYQMVYLCVCCILVFILSSLWSWAWCCKIRALEKKFRQSVV